MNAPMQQPNYRGYPQQAAYRSPATPRRHGPVPGMPMPQHPPQAMPNQQMLGQRHASNPVEAAVRRSRKPTDKNLPDNVEDIVIGDVAQQYKRLREVEKRLDASMVRKRLDIYDSINKNAKRYRTMRIWISNTVESQPWQQQDASNSEGAMGTKLGAGRYRVKIEGRLLDEADPLVPDESDDEGETENQGGEPGAMEEDTPSAKSSKPIPQRKRLSQFFKSITIDFDKPTENGVADLATITWNKPDVPANAATMPPSADFDTLEFSRAAEVNLNVTVNLVRDETPERFQLSRELAAILDVENDTRAGIVAGIWEYVKAMGLQENEEKRTIQCDDRLRAIFGCEKMYFPAIPESTTTHTATLPPIKLPYTIRVDQEFQKDPKPTVYDIRVAIDDPLRAKLISLTNSPDFPTMLRHVSSLDDQVALAIQALHHSKAKHSFYTAMSKDPANFMKRWINSQKRDLETVLGETPRPGQGERGMEFRRGGEGSAWDTAVARESVRYMLAKPPRATR
ncbi:SWI/SNF and RSC complexes subunit [Trichophyton mentagrophytes]|nr:SWI/SNF and RSC complexes subunit [Trichophyton mentagrophytes]